MNYYTLLFYPKFEDGKVNEFRKKYDEHHKQWKAHLTLVFPISDKEIEENIMVSHIESILKKWKKFDIHIKGLEKSWDHWLFIVLKEGKGNIIKFHDELYTGPLKKFLRKDIEFIPHIAVGQFIKNKNYALIDPKEFQLDKDQFEKAHKEADKMNFDYWSKFDKIVLEKFDENLNHSRVVKEFKLN